MPRGASAKREREYKTLERKLAKSGRYGGRAQEVAARIVNEQRREFGETRGAKAQEARGDAPDGDLPIRGYQHLTVPQIVSRLDRLSAAQVRAVRRYEEKHRHRTTLLAALDRRRG